MRIKEIKLIFTRAGGNTFELPAQSYLRGSDEGAIMFTPFRLEPSIEWAHIVNFFNNWNRDEEKEYRHLESAIRSNILSQKEKPENKEKLCEADHNDMKKLIAFFKQHYRWEAGEWKVELRIITNQKRANICREYHFTLFESESKELFDYAERYKYGGGVYWNDSAYQTGLTFPIYEK